MNEDLLILIYVASTILSIAVLVCFFLMAKWVYDIKNSIDELIQMKKDTIRDEENKRLIDFYNSSKI